MHLKYFCLKQMKLKKMRLEAWIFLLTISYRGSGIVQWVSECFASLFSLAQISYCEQQRIKLQVFMEVLRLLAMKVQYVKSCPMSLILGMSCCMWSSHCEVHGMRNGTGLVLGAHYDWLAYSVYYYKGRPLRQVCITIVNICISIFKIGWDGISVSEIKPFLEDSLKCQKWEDWDLLN